MMQLVDLDANFLIAAVDADTAEAIQMTAWIEAGDELWISAVAWGEFQCGPLSPDKEVLARETLDGVRALEAADAERAAELFNLTGRRSRSFADCCIAASAIRAGAKLATVNLDDFKAMVVHGLEFA